MVSFKVLRVLLKTSCRIKLCGFECCLVQTHRGLSFICVGSKNRPWTHQRRREFKLARRWIPTGSRVDVFSRPLTFPPRRQTERRGLPVSAREFQLNFPALSCWTLQVAGHVQACPPGSLLLLLFVILTAAPCSDAPSWHNHLAETRCVCVCWEIISSSVAAQFRS